MPPAENDNPRRADLEIPPAPGEPDAPGASPPLFPPWPIWECLLVLALFTLTQLAVTAGVAALIHLLIPVETASSDRFRLFLGIALPLSLFISHLAGWGAVVYLVVVRRQTGFIAGLRLERYPWIRLGGALLAGLLMQILAALLALLVPPPEDFISPVEEFLRLGGWAVPLLFVMAVLMAPPLEEVLFRGLLLPALRRKHGFVFSALVVTTLFTGMHATQTGSYWPPLVGIFLCGWMLALLRERSGSLWPSIAFHIGFNATAFLPLFFIDQLV